MSSRGTGPCRRRVACAAVLAMVVVTWAAAVVRAGTGLIVASATGAGVPVPVAGSFAGGDVPAAVTPDGRFVAFCGTTPASVAVGVLDVNGSPELYVRDMLTGTLSLVTYNGAGTSAAGGCQHPPSISDDGRFVGFRSDVPAGSYVFNVTDTNGAPDAFVRDRQSGVTTLLSVSADFTGTATGVTGGPVIAPGGAAAAFTSAATTLVAPFANLNGAADDLYVRSIDKGVTVLASAAASAPAAGHDGSTLVLAPSPRVFSDDGRFLVFGSDATNLLAGASQLQLYRRDLQLGTTELVSARTATTGTTGGRLDPDAPAFSASADGQRVAFTALSANLATIATDPGIRQVFLRDMATKETLLVTVAAGGGAGANAAADQPLVSRDGQVVVFSSTATNLVTRSYPALARRYAFARQLAAGTTEILSLTPSGALPDGDTSVGDISASGRYVGLSTRATNLSDASDTNLAPDVAVRDRVAGTTTVASTIASGAQTANQGAVTPLWVSELGEATFPSQSTDLVAGASGNLIYGVGVNQRFLSLSGTVRRNGAPLPGVTVTLSGSQSGSAVTGPAGTFAFDGLTASGSYTVTPVLAGFLFTPPSVSVSNLQGDTVVTFTAIRPAIRGTVTLLGAGLEGVTVRLAGSATAAAQTATDGSFAFPDVPAGGTFTVTPERPGYSFAPPSRTLAAIVTDQVADFAATCLGTVSGVVRDRLDAPVPGVTLTLQPAGTTTTSDNDGRFAFGGVTPGSTVTIQATRSGFTFEPASQQVTTTACATTLPVAFVTATGLFTRYFAEGATGPFFDTGIALLNATGTPTTARVTFQTRSGASVSQDVSLAGLARATVNPELLPGLEDAEFSTVIVSGQPVIADRTMRWDARGYGSHAETSVAQPLSSWYLAEGATISGFNLFYLVQNPNDEAAQVRITYLLPEPRAPVERTHVVAPRSRATIWVNTEGGPLGAAEVSAVIAASVPVIVERAMYRDSGGQFLGAGHASAGVAGPAASWFFAEGATGPYFDLFFLIANPGASVAEVEARYLLPDGTVLTKGYRIPARSRFNVWADLETFDGRSGLPLADTAVSASFTSTNGVPIVVERAMWWPEAPGTWIEGHNAAGALATGTKWALADGEVGGPFDVETYVLIANTSATDAAVEVKLVFEDGTTSASLVTVRAGSRANFDVAREVPASRGRRFGAIVESLGGAPAQIVVERAMYSDASGVNWAAGTAALATRLR